jgi:hypothetical protein
MPDESTADLMVDYSLLHQLADNARQLRENLDITPPTSGGGGSSRGGDDRGPRAVRAVVLANAGTTAVSQLNADSVGDYGLFAQLTTFYSRWNQPFHDAMSRLDELASMLDGVATKFFDMDADFAAKANQMLLGFKVDEWQSQKQEYDHYQEMKDKTISWQMFDKDGNSYTQTEHLIDPDAEPPADPGARPDSAATNGAQTNTTYNPDGTIQTETSTVAGPGGLNYGQSTSYTYGADANGDGRPDVVSSSTTITHADGTKETLGRVNNPNGTYVITDTTPDGNSITTVTPSGTGQGYNAASVDTQGRATSTSVVDNPAGTTDTKTVTTGDKVEVYHGDAEADTWDRVSSTPVGKPAGQNGSPSGSEDAPATSTHTPGGSRQNS